MPTGAMLDNRLVGHHKIHALQMAKLPRSGREGAVEVRPFPASTKAQGLSSEAVKGNPTTTVIPRVDESKMFDERYWLIPRRTIRTKRRYPAFHVSPRICLRTLSLEALEASDLSYAGQQVDKRPTAQLPEFPLFQNCVLKLLSFFSNSFRIMFSIIRFDTHRGTMITETISAASKSPTMGQMIPARGGTQQGM
jgi:hypothetical protein